MRHDVFFRYKGILIFCNILVFLLLLSKDIIKSRKVVLEYCQMREGSWSTQVSFSHNTCHVNSCCYALNWIRSDAKKQSLSSCNLFVITYSCLHSFPGLAVYVSGIDNLCKTVHYRPEVAEFIWSEESGAGLTSFTRCLGSPRRPGILAVQTPFLQLIDVLPKVPSPLSPLLMFLSSAIINYHYSLLCYPLSSPSFVHALIALNLPCLPSLPFTPFVLSLSLLSPTWVVLTCRWMAWASD